MMRRRKGISFAVLARSFLWKEHVFPKPIPTVLYLPMMHHTRSTFPPMILAVDWQVWNACESLFFAGKGRTCQGIYWWRWVFGTERYGSVWPRKSIMSRRWLPAFRLSFCVLYCIIVQSEAWHARKVPADAFV